MPTFAIVGLPDKAVAESRERVRSALNAIGLALPPKRITVNLAPADLPKEGSHYDLPIALGVMAAIGAIARDAIEGYCVLGSSRSTARSRPSPARCRRRSARMRSKGPDLSGAVRGGSRLGRHRHADPGASRPAPAHQSLQRPADLATAGGRRRTRAMRRCRISRTSRARRPPSATLEVAAAGGHHLLDDRPDRAPASRCWRGGCPRSCRRSRPPRCSK